MAKHTCGVNTKRFLKYVWPFFNIMQEKVDYFVSLKKNFAVGYISTYSSTNKRDVMLKRNSSSGTISFAFVLFVFYVCLFIFVFLV